MTIVADLDKTAATPASDAFRDAMRQLASGVSIVTAGLDKEWTGMTVTAVTSLSLDPPTILVCVNRTASIVPFLQRYWHFAVSFLPGDQHALADRFTGRGGFEGIDRFQSGDWTTLVSGAPVLAGALASLDCRLEELIPRHTHLIAIGRVLCVGVKDRPELLLHWRGGFARLPASSVRQS